MKTLQERQADKFDIGYRPDGRTAENPPRFSFMPEECAKYYCLEIAQDISFEQAETFHNLPLNFFTPDKIFPVGHYFWRYAVEEDGERQSEWSSVRQFEIRGGETQTPLPGRAQRYRNLSKQHPRLWMNPQRIQEIGEQMQKDPASYGFDAFLHHGVKPYENQSFRDAPPENPDRRDPTKCHNAVWRSSYSYAQEALYKIKHLSIAGKLLKREDWLEKAKKSLLDIAAWDPEGTTSEEYNDEAAFRVLRALAWGYDWLHERLSDDEKEKVCLALLRRGKQVYQRDVVKAKIHQTPYESHPVRSLSMVLIPCGIALLGEVPEAEDWLNYALEYLACIYSPWGGEDGGWAEGGAYWTTAMASVLEGLDLTWRYMGIDLLKRPFFQHTGDFILQCYSPKQIHASFCDQSNLGEYPPLKTGFLMRHLAALTGNAEYQWYYEQMLPWETEKFTAFYNYGWWNFYFDDFAIRCDWGDLEARPPSAEPQIKWFHDVGWVAMHKDMGDEKKHITLLLKSSPYGCISHSHGDQNGFILHAYGEPMAIESGYYVAYGSDMHLKWRKQTQSTNNILIDGIGQYAGKNKHSQLDATGNILDAGQQDGVLYAKAEAAQAYRLTVPTLKSYRRNIYFVDGAYFVIEDNVELTEEKPIQWLLHSLQPFQLGANKAVMQGNAANMRVEFITGGMTLSQMDTFDKAIRPQELEGKAAQWHLCAQTLPATRHRIVTLVVPEKHGEEKKILVSQENGTIRFLYKNEFQVKKE